MSDDMVNNLKKPSAWFRVLFMAGFVLALYVTGIILLVMMLAQIIFSLLTGEDNINLRRLGAGLTNYVGQILAFLTYNSEQKPFPFLPFPLEPGQDAFQAESVDAEPVATEPPATQSAAAGSPEQAQAVADDDGFQNPSERSEAFTTEADDIEAPLTEPSRSTGPKTGRKKKSTDQEAPQTDE